MSRRRSTIARRLAATAALTGTLALSFLIGGGQPAASAGGGDGNWPKPSAARIVIPLN